jgi:uncharacterized membrane protein
MLRFSFLKIVIKYGFSSFATCLGLLLFYFLFLQNAVPVYGEGLNSSTTLFFRFLSAHKKTFAILLKTGVSISPRPLAKNEPVTPSFVVQWQ